MERPSLVPERIDIDRPAPARMHDYALGGVHNLAADRELVTQVAQLMPDMVPHLRAERAFVHRAVRLCVQAGIRQFLLFGAGIAVRGDVSDMVQRAAPEARVMYIDLDSGPLKPGHENLIRNDRTGLIQADLSRLEHILIHPDVRGLLDFDQPMAVPLNILHFLPEDAARMTVAVLRDAVAPGSYLSISHLTVETRPEITEILPMIGQRTGFAMRPRSRVEVERLFAGLELVEPGLVWTHEWRPDPAHSPAADLDRPFFLCGVGRKP